MQAASLASQAASHPLLDVCAPLLDADEPPPAFATVKEPVKLKLIVNSFSLRFPRM